jgi:hypothetical protein
VRRLRPIWTHHGFVRRKEIGNCHYFNSLVYDKEYELYLMFVYNAGSRIACQLGVLVEILGLNLVELPEAATSDVDANGIITRNAIAPAVEGGET